jgi:iron complex transport system permease protein
MSETWREKTGVAVGASALALLIMVALGVLVGAEPMSLTKAIDDMSSIDHAILFEARLPRVLLGVIAGGGLAAVGLSFQTILRNPLAEPFILGVSGGAALGATIALLFGLTGITLLGASLVPAAALVGGIAATALVASVARAGAADGFEDASSSRAGSGASILLAGVVVNAIAAAAITFLKTIVTATKAQELLYWLMGFLDVASGKTLLFIFIYVAIGGAVLLRDAPRLNLLALGDESAEHLGIDVRALERRTFLACSLIVAAIVSVTGLIGFIGLIVPHALRRIFGSDVRVTLPATFFAGGAVLVACDLVSRTLFRLLHTEPPVGAVTALIGGPLFLLLLRRRAS